MVVMAPGRTEHAILPCGYQHVILDAIFGVLENPADVEGKWYYIGGSTDKPCAVILDGQDRFVGTVANQQSAQRVIEILGEERPNYSLLSTDTYWFLLKYAVRNAHVRTIGDPRTWEQEDGYIFTGDRLPFSLALPDEVWEQLMGDLLAIYDQAPETAGL